jgi:hypothetical protein
MAAHGEQGRAGQGKARLVKARQGKTGQGKACLVRAGQGVQVVANQGMAGHSG